MRILVVSMSAELGGIEKSLITFLKYLVSLPNSSVDLMLWKDRGELLDDIPREVRRITSPTPGNLSEILYAMDFVRLYSYFKLKCYTRIGYPWKAFPVMGDSYDVAISYTQDGYSPYYVIDKVRASKKFMWFHHGEYLRTGFHKELDRKYYCQFNKVVTVSDTIKSKLCRELPECIGCFQVVPNLIDVAEILRKSQEQGVFIDGENLVKCVTVGRITPEKGQLKALEIALELRTRGVDFIWIFVGDGPDMQKCLEFVNLKDLQECVKFVGAKKNPYPYIKQADIYISTSYVEADPLTIQEALILGKYIIASNIPSIKEALQNGTLGKICELNSYAFADEICAFIESRNNLQTYSENIMRTPSRNTITISNLDKLLFTNQ